MIELPRAALTADEIASEAEFFSFGTNDLTQTTFGLSRDDAGKFLPFYMENGILPDDPFVVARPDGVGKLVKMACRAGARRPDRTSSSASAASMAAIRPRSSSATRRAGLCLLLAVPGADRPAGSGPRRTEFLINLSIWMAKRGWIN